jgi:hypothetical protein
MNIHSGIATVVKECCIPYICAPAHTFASEVSDTFLRHLCTSTLSAHSLPTFKKYICIGFEAIQLSGLTCMFTFLHHHLGPPAKRPLCPHPFPQLSLIRFLTKEEEFLDLVCRASSHTCTPRHRAPCQTSGTTTQRFPQCWLVTDVACHSASCTQSEWPAVVWLHDSRGLQPPCQAAGRSAWRISESLWLLWYIPQVFRLCDILICNMLMLMIFDSGTAVFRACSGMLV